MNIIIYFFAFIVIIYFPLAVIQFAGILKNIIEKHHKNIYILNPPVSGREIIVEITTNGGNPDTVDSIIETLKSYSLGLKIYVVKEENDKYKYSADEIVIPSSYETPNGSRTKLRALQYAIEELHRMGYGKETYICHLDDDSIVEKDYLRFVYSMDGVAGQGEIRLREYGVHLMSTLADFIRVSDCDIYCKHFNSHGRAMFVHGEGLVIRADIEYEFGWDYATYGADDVIMGNLVSRKYGFERIPYHIFISPPVSAKDFYKQRRRWMAAIILARKKLWNISHKLMFFLFYRYVVGWVGLFGFAFLIYGIIFGLKMPVILMIMSIFDTASYFAIYQYGALNTNKKYAILTFVVQYGISLYEGLTLWYSIFFPPDTSTFDVIHKVPVKSTNKNDKPINKNEVR